MRLVDQELMSEPVTRRVDQDAIRGVPIPPGATGLLVVALGANPGI